MNFGALIIFRSSSRIVYRLLLRRGYGSGRFRNRGRGTVMSHSGSSTSGNHRFNPNGREAPTAAVLGGLPQASARPQFRRTLRWLEVHVSIRKSVCSRDILGFASARVLHVVRRDPYVPVSEPICTFTRTRRFAAGQLSRRPPLGPGAGVMGDDGGQSSLRIEPPLVETIGAAHYGGNMRLPWRPTIQKL
jgi:hypothetical protein